MIQVAADLRYNPLPRKVESMSELVYFVERPNTLKEPKLERHLFSVLTCVLIAPSGEQLWVKTIQGYWLIVTKELVAAEAWSRNCVLPT